MGVRYIFGQDGAFRTEPVIVAKNITENGTYDPATEGADGYAPVVVNVEGGGGSSDFSTAKMTIANMDGYVDVYAPIVEDNMTKTTQSIPAGEYDIILYKGKARVRIYIDPEYFTISGDITLDDGSYIVEGDFGITYNA